MNLEIRDKENMRNEPKNAMAIRLGPIFLSKFLKKEVNKIDFISCFTIYTSLLKKEIKIPF